MIRQATPTWALVLHWYTQDRLGTASSTPTLTAANLKLINLLPDKLSNYSKLASFRSMDSLPSELKFHIGTFCTPVTLASLAQVHTSYRSESERVLYKKISIRTSAGQVKCLDTLSSNTQKAIMVRSLTIEFPGTWSSETCNTISVLSRALLNLHSLSHLRIKLPGKKPEDEPMLSQFNGAIRGTGFMLVTLYCNDYLDIAEIIQKQSRLQLLGIYTNGGDEKLLRKLCSLDTSGSKASDLPTVVSLERESFLPFYNHIGVFPALSLTTQSTIFQSCAASFRQDDSRSLATSVEHVSQASIYINDLSTPGLIDDILRDMVRSFPHVYWLNLVLRTPNINYPELAASLSLVTKLMELDFLMWDYGDSGNNGLSFNEKLGYAREWKKACPGLRQVTYLDGMTLEKNEGGWEILS